MSNPTALPDAVSSPAAAPPQRVRIKVKRGTAILGLGMAAAALLGIGGTWLRNSHQGALSAAANADPSKEHVLYMVGYSHLDTEWCWNYPQVIREFLPNTLHQNFDLFEKYPDYVFNWTGANRYHFIKEYYPEDYERLKEYVAKGRWITSGSSLEEGDVNIPSPESLIRQVLYGNQFFHREFGTTSNEFMLPDSFGFPAALPSVLAHCGLTGFSTQKLTWGSAVGIPFNVGTWAGPDGTSVLAAFNPGAYDKTIREDLSESNTWYDRIDANGKKSGIYADYCYYGAGDRGGAPDEESVKWIERSVKGKGKVRVVSARAEDLFTRIKPAPAADGKAPSAAAPALSTASLPKFSGDLLLTQHSSGTATSQAMMKRWNRKNEYLADSAERSSVAAALLGAQPYPQQRITDAWLRFLPGQFHDIMAGTALPESYEYAWNDQILAMNEFAGVIEQSVGGVTRALDTRAAGVPLVVYNPLSIDRADMVEATVTFPGAAPKAVRVIGPDGKETPAQVVGTSGHNAHILFLARVPSVGFATFDVRPAATAAPSALQVTSHSLENARYRVTLNAKGDVASVYDKQAKQEMLSAPARLAFQYERPREFPAWNMDWEDQQKPPRSYVDGPATIRVVENGPARVALQVERAANGSRFFQTIRLSAGDAGDRVEFDTRIEWRSEECALKAIFPLAVSNSDATYDQGLGTVVRGNNNPSQYEVPAHEWFDVTQKNGSYGVSVLNDSKYGSDKPDDSTVRLTLLYTPGVRGAYQHQASQDWGRHEMLYALQGHSGDWRDAGTPRVAARLNQPLVAFQTPAHPGTQGRSFSLLRVEGQDVVVAALKHAEDSDETIVRFFETHGEPAKNVRLSMAAPIQEFHEVNGQEQTVPSTGAAALQQGGLVFDMSAYRPRAFALTLGKTPNPLTPPSATPLHLTYDTDVVSSKGSPKDGAFDETGRTIPAEMLPEHLECGGIPFTLGPTADRARNAIACNGQTISLPAPAPAPGHRRVYLLAAAYGGDTPAAFRINGATASRAVPITIQDWSGFIGQWDTRLWKGRVPELAYSWNNPLGGLVPGYIKRDPVAWYSDHWRLADGTLDPYRFCYIFRYALDLPADAKSLTLPRNPRIRVLAATVGVNPNEDARPAQPLYDTMDGQVSNVAPTIAPAGGTFHNAISVTLRAPFYFDEVTGRGGLHYTLDGSTPGPNSPVYTGALTLTRSATLTVRGLGGTIRKARFNISDTDAPRIVDATAVGSSDVRVTFSEPVTPESAERAGSYTLQPDVPVRSVRLDPSGRTVVLSLATPLPASGSRSIMIRGVRDRSDAGNAISGATHSLASLRPVFTAQDTQTFPLPGNAPNMTGTPAPNLPIRAGDHWTINMFVYLDQQPEELSLLGGFGSGADETGRQRYLVKFHDSIHFWGSNIDINSGKTFDIARWQMVTITYDGATIRLYKDGQELKSAPATLADAAATVKIGTIGPWGNTGHFAGKISDFTIWNEALSPSFLRSLQAAHK